PTRGGGGGGSRPTPADAPHRGDLKARRRNVLRQRGEAKAAETSEPTRRLRPANERHKKTDGEDDREPDPPHGGTSVKDAGGEFSRRRLLARADRVGRARAIR